MIGVWTDWIIAVEINVWVSNVFEQKSNMHVLNLKDLHVLFFLCNWAVTLGLNVCLAIFSLLRVLILGDMSAISGCVVPV